MSNARKPNAPAPTIGTSAAPGHTNLKEDRTERELDEALQETFPASDPIAVAADRESVESGLDEAVEDTFPASDPVAIDPAPAKRRGGREPGA